MPSAKYYSTDMLRKIDSPPSSQICLRRDKPLIVPVSKAPKERNFFSPGCNPGFGRCRFPLPSAGAQSPFENDISLPARQGRGLVLSD